MDPLAPEDTRIPTPPTTQAAPAGPPQAGLDTPLEHRLRVRIDDLLDERERLRRRIGKLIRANDRNYRRWQDARIWRDRALGRPTWKKAA